jgi:hypothetical protein
MAELPKDVIFGALGFFIGWVSRCLVVQSGLAFEFRQPDSPTFFLQPERNAKALQAAANRNISHSHSSCTLRRFLHHVHLARLSFKVGNHKPVDFSELG